MPEKLDFPSRTMGEWDEPDDPVDLDNMHSAESALGKVSLPPKACFVPGKAVHVQFDSGSQEGHAMGGFVIQDMDGKSSRLDNTTGLDGPTMRLRALLSGTPFNVYPSSSRSNHP